MNFLIPRNKKMLGIYIGLILNGYLTDSHARDHFNPELLERNNASSKNIDLSSFEQGMQKPGKYRVDIILNGIYIDSQDITFSVKANKKDLYPCLSISLAKQMGLNINQFPDLKENDGCLNWEIIPASTSDYQIANQQLQFSFPQSSVLANPRGYVPPEQWEQGIGALLLNYSVSGDETHSKTTGSSNSQYANLRPGINIGAWRIRNYLTLNRDSQGQSSTDYVYGYAQRDIIALKSRLVLGDSSSSSDIFDSVSFRGVQLSSDEDMMPDSLRGYAPVIRGNAKSNAQVIIRQNDYIIYQSYVPAGIFEIKDLYSTGGSGDLNVTVKEQDGSSHNFIVPYASLPVLQREGNLKYSLTAATYRSYNNEIKETPFTQSTAIYGIPFGITIYGGSQLSRQYQSLAVGAGKNFGEIGAFSADVIGARSEPHNIEASSGRSFRVRYSKDFVSLGTNFAIAGYRYSSKGFYDLTEVMESYGNDDSISDRRRNRAEMSLSQSLGESMGSITGSIVQEQYWNDELTMRSYGISYSNSYHGMGYTFNYSYNKNTSSGNSNYDYYNDRTIMLNVSIPLSQFLSNTWVNYNINNSQSGGDSQTIGLSGIALSGENLSWNLQESKDRTGSAFSMNTDYRGALAEISTGYNTNPTSNQIHYQVTGGIVAHGDGVTLSQPLGETLALIEAKDAHGTGVVNQPGTKIDTFGFAIVNNLTPYHKNAITLDTSTLSDDVDIESNGSNVVPTKGAIVKAKFAAHAGYKTIITLKTASGYVPFGAIVSVSGSVDSRSYITGNAGQVYITGMANKQGTLEARWGDGVSELCKAHYSLGESPVAGGIYKSLTICE